MRRLLHFLFFCCAEFFFYFYFYLQFCATVMNAFYIICTYKKMLVNEAHWHICKLLPLFLFPLILFLRLQLASSEWS